MTQSTVRKSKKRDRDLNGTLSHGNGKPTNWMLVRTHGQNKVGFKVNSQNLTKFDQVLLFLDLTLKPTIRVKHFGRLPRRNGG